MSTRISHSCLDALTGMELLRYMGSRWTIGVLAALGLFLHSPKLEVSHCSIMQEKPRIK